MLAWEEWEDKKLAEDKRNKLLFIRRFGERESDYMEQGVFGRKGIETLSRAYMPVKVDADERPDIFARYGLRYTPTVMLLTQDGRTLGGGNFCDYETFIKFMMEVGTLISREREIIEKYGAESIEDDSEQEISLRDKGKLADMVNSLAEKFADSPLPSAELLLTLLEFFLRKKDERRCRKIIDELGKIEDKVEGGIFSGQLVRNPLRFSTKKTAEENSKYASLLFEFAETFGDDEAGKKAEKQAEFLFNTMKTGDFFSRSIAEDDEYYKSTKSLRELRQKPPKDERIFCDSNLEVCLNLSRMKKKEEAMKVFGKLAEYLADGKKVFHSGKKDIYNLTKDIALFLLCSSELSSEDEKKHALLESLKEKKGKFLYFDFSPSSFGFLGKKKIDPEANLYLALYFKKVGDSSEAQNIISGLVPFLDDSPTLMLKWWMNAEEIL